MNVINQKNRAVKLMVGNTIAFLFMIIINFLANYLPLNGVPTDEISDQYQNIFTPAGFTFIIWGVIYLLLTVLMIYLIKGLITQNKKAYQIILQMKWYFLASSLLNGGWLFAWHYDQIFLTLIIMIGLLISLIMVYKSLKNLSYTPDFYQIPFSVYLGWITVATIANIFVFSKAMELSGLGLPAEFWFTIILLVILGITAGFVIKMKDMAYGLVILWALTGIFSARLTESGWTYASYVTAGAILLVILILFQQRRTR